VKKTQVTTANAHRIIFSRINHLMCSSVVDGQACGLCLVAVGKRRPLEMPAFDQ
jgi:hypothetical protein